MRRRANRERESRWPRSLEGENAERKKEKLASSFQRLPPRHPPSRGAVVVSSHLHLGPAALLLLLVRWRLLAHGRLCFCLVVVVIITALLFFRCLRFFGVGVGVGVVVLFLFLLGCCCCCCLALLRRRPRGHKGLGVSCEGGPGRRPPVRCGDGDGSGRHGARERTRALFSLSSKREAKKVKNKFVRSLTENHSSSSEEEEHQNRPRFLSLSLSLSACRLSSLQLSL